MTAHKDRNGFSLIELLTTLAIISTIAAIGTTMILNYLPNMRLKSSSRDIFSAMMLAKSEAIKGNTYAAVIFDTSVTPATFSVFLDNSGDDGSGDAGNGKQDGSELTLLEPIDLPTNIEFGPVDLNGDGDYTDSGETAAASGITFPSYSASNYTLIFNPKGIPGDDSNSLMSGTAGLRAVDSGGNVIRSRSVTVSTAGRIKLN